MRVDYTHIPRYIQTCDMNCGSAFEPGASGLPYYCTPPVCVPAVLGALAVWRQNIKKLKIKAVNVKKALWRNIFLWNKFRMAKCLSHFSKIRRDSFHVKLLWRYEGRKVVYQNPGKISEISLAKLSRKFGHASILHVKSLWTMKISGSLSLIAKTFRWLQNNFLRSSLTSICLIVSGQYSYIYMGIR